MHTLVRVDNQRRGTAPETDRARTSAGSAGKKRPAQAGTARRRTGRPFTGNRLLAACALLSLIAALLLIVLLFLLPEQTDQESPSRSATRVTPAGKSAADPPADESAGAAGGGTAPAAEGAGQTETRRSPQEVRTPETAHEPEKISAAAPARETGTVPSTGPETPAALKGTLQIVIDDVGYNTSQLEPFLDFPGPITFAVLPGLQYTEEAVRLIRAAGKDAILHLPMEAVGGADPGPGALYRSMSDKELLTVLSINFDQIPGLRGLNNHQGSAVTADERIMRLLFGELKKRGLFFLDSLTTSRSLGKKLAGEYGLEYLERSVFLDNDQTTQAIRAAVESGLNLAGRHGHAVMIGHVWSAELAEVLIEMYPFLLEEGYEFTNLPGLLKAGSDYGPRP